MNYVMRCAVLSVSDESFFPRLFSLSLSHSSFSFDVQSHTEFVMQSSFNSILDFRKYLNTFFALCGPFLFNSVSFFLFLSLFIHFTSSHVLLLVWLLLLFHRSTIINFVSR